MTVTGIEIDGREARAEAAFVGSDLDGPDRDQVQGLAEDCARRAEGDQSA